MKASLPKLPPSVEATVLTAANSIAQALAEAELSPITDDGAPTPELYTVLYLLKQHCLQRIKGEPSRDSYHIPLNEIAAALETIGRIMAGDGLPEYVGFNASWYMDAADMVSKTEQDLSAQMVAIEKLLTRGLKAVGKDEGNS